jgi:hypothetical protein
MNLRRFIDHYYGGNRQSFRAAVGVSPKTVYRWLTLGAVINEGAIYLPVRQLPDVPEIRPDYRRDDFESMLKQDDSECDLVRIGDHYVCPTTQAMWDGWCKAQAQFTTESLTTSL